MATVVQYQTEDGNVTFEKWFSSLNAKAALKVRTAIAQMEVGNFGDHKSLGDGVWERRINFEKGYRVYFAKEGTEFVILFCGGTKVRQQSDIERAKAYCAEYKKRKKKEQEERAQEAKAKPRRPKKKRRK